VTLRIRPQTPADFAAIAVLESPIVGVPLDAGEIGKQAESGPSFCALVAERDGQVVGRASAGFMPQHTPAGDMRCLVAVSPRLRRQGIGTALWNALQALLAKRRPNNLRANVDATDSRDIAWAQGQGFAVEHHHLFHTLDLTRLDPLAGQCQIDEAERQGYRFVTFDQLRSPENEKRFHALYTELDAETPDFVAGDSPTWEDWQAWALDGESSTPALWVLAMAPDGSWAGLTMPQRDSAERAHIFLTGVTRAHRGKGLSVAMKALAARLARSQGYRVMSTLNHAANGPILAANRRLGYSVEQSIYRVVKPCAYPDA
jgi:GNAT superfamily N-acetyltransferase